jgi:hypothetical protein
LFLILNTEVEVQEFTGQLRCSASEERREVEDG